MQTKGEYVRKNVTGKLHTKVAGKLQSSLTFRVARAEHGSLYIGNSTHSFKTTSFFCSEFILAKKSRRVLIGISCIFGRNRANGS